MTYTDSNARFQFDDVTIICRLIEGKYPNYEAVIPGQPQPHGHRPNQLPAGHPSRFHFCARPRIKDAAEARRQQLVVSAEDLDFANEASERLNCSYTGEDMEIGFNSRFLMDMLNNLPMPRCPWKCLHQTVRASSSRRKPKKKEKMC